MTVKELISHLQTLPEDYEVHFRGYSCGSVWHASAEPQDFREQIHLLSDNRIVEINAEWN